MEIKQPKAKKFCKIQPKCDLPLNKKFHGIFNGFSVLITNDQEMKEIVSMGFFGKANFSRSFPQFQNCSEIIRERQFFNRKQFISNNSRKQKIIVIPDSDDEYDYFTNLAPKYEIDQSGIKENVHLNLEEAFFLFHALNCLEISQNNQLLNYLQVWELFKTTDKNFFENYIVYYYYRTRNWIVKPGIKFGGNFLLYKQGPTYFHASFLVKIVRQNENFINLMGLQRLCETAGKELLICQIQMPENRENVDFNKLSLFTVKETVMKRWLSNQERQEST